MKVLCKEFLNKISSSIKELYNFNDQIKNYPIQKVSTDTRSMQMGDCFFAIPGPTFDPLDFAQELINKKCSLLICQGTKLNTLIKAKIPIVLVENVIKSMGSMANLWIKQCKANRIAITGSAGKTTTKEVVSHLCSSAFSVHKTKGNLNNQIGLPKTLFELSTEHEISILELGTYYPGEIEALTKICQPDVGCIINIGASHLEGLKTIEGVAQEKKSLFTYMSNDSLAIVNLDDPFNKKLTEHHSGPITTYSLNNKSADLYITKNERLPSYSPTDPIGKTKVEFCYKDELYTALLPDLGNSFLYAGLVGLSIGFKLGIHFEKMRNSLENFQGINDRLKISALQENLWLVNDCYNANPLSMKSTLNTFHQNFSQFFRIIILGDMLELGPQSDSFHEELGSFVSTFKPDILIGIGSYSKHMTKVAIKKGLSYSHVFYFNNLQKLDKIFNTVQNSISNLDSAKLKKKALLVKASRGIELDKLVALIEKHYSKER